MHIYPPSEAAVLRLNLKLERKKAEERPEENQRQVKGRKEQLEQPKEQPQPQGANNKDERKQAASGPVAPQRNATERGRPRGKAQEDEAIQRLLKKRGLEAPKAPEESFIAARWSRSY